MVEEIPYNVKKRIEEVEIRKYPSVILAKVGNSDPNFSFRILFDFIQGANGSDKQISMTVPVISTRKISMTAPVISDGDTFSFVMPHEMRLEEVPIPRDKRISIKEVEGRKLAVIRFNGRTRPDRVYRFEERLMDVLSDHDIAPKSKPFLMRYNPPFVPGFFRRNEVAVEI